MNSTSLAQRGRGGRVDQRPQPAGQLPAAGGLAGAAASAVGAGGRADILTGLNK